MCGPLQGAGFSGLAHSPLHRSLLTHPLPNRDSLWHFGWLPISPVDTCFAWKPTWLPCLCMGWSWITQVEADSAEHQWGKGSFWLCSNRHVTLSLCARKLIWLTCAWAVKWESGGSSNSSTEPHSEDPRPTCRGSEGQSEYHPDN